MNIVILDSGTLGADIDLEPIRALGDVIEYKQTLPGEIAERLTDADVAVLNKCKLNRENLTEAKNLKLICVAATGYDNIDLTFICGMGCEDWVPTVTTQERIDRVLANAADGQIVLLHDMEWNVNTVEALKTIIPELKKRGYEFATVSQIFKMKNVTPKRGWLYSNVLQTESDNRL